MSDFSARPVRVKMISGEFGALFIDGGLC